MRRTTPSGGVRRDQDPGAGQQPERLGQSEQLVTGLLQAAQQQTVKLPDEDEAERLPVVAALKHTQDIMNQTADGSAPAPASAAAKAACRPGPSRCGSHPAPPAWRP